MVLVELYQEEILLDRPIQIGSGKTLYDSSNKAILEKFKLKITDPIKEVVKKWWQ